MRKKIFLSYFIFMFSIFLVACSSNVDSANVRNKQLSSIKNDVTEKKSEKILELTGDKIVEDNIIEIKETSPDKYEKITIGFVGDIYLGDDVYSCYKSANNNVNGFLSDFLVSEFRNMDIMIANHEYVATNETQRDTKQLYNFKAPMEREYLWNELGVDVVSLANNHAMDYGEQSLYDTISALDNENIAHIGAGENLEAAKKAEIIEINGKKIAIIAATRFIVDGSWYATENSPGILTTYDTTQYFQIVKDEISRLKTEEKCDFVAIYVHFGKEKSNQILDNQKVIAHGYIDAGANLVIGSHAHCLQGIEIYKGVPIYYNLGNFLFSSYKVDTMMVEISINEDNSCDTKIIPCISEKYRTVNVERDEAKRILNYIESISVNIQIDEKGIVTEKTNDN